MATNEGMPLKLRICKAGTIIEMPVTADWLYRGKQNGTVDFTATFESFPWDEEFAKQAEELRVERMRRRDAEAKAGNAEARVKDVEAKAKDDQGVLDRCIDHWKNEAEKARTQYEGARSREIEECREKNTRELKLKEIKRRLQCSMWYRGGEDRSLDAVIDEAVVRLKAGADVWKDLAQARAERDSYQRDNTATRFVLARIMGIPKEEVALGYSLDNLLGMIEGHTEFLLEDRDRLHAEFVKASGCDQVGVGNCRNESRDDVSCEQKTPETAQMPVVPGLAGSAGVSYPAEVAGEWVDAYRSCYVKFNLAGTCKVRFDSDAKDKRIKELEETVEDLRSRVKNQCTTIQDMDTTIGGQRVLIKAKDNYIADLKQKIEGKDAKIKNLEAEVKHWRDLYNGTASIISDMTDHMKKQGGTIDTLEARIKTLERDKALAMGRGTDDRIIALNERVRELQEDRNALSIQYGQAVEQCTDAVDRLKFMEDELAKANDRIKFLEKGTFNAEERVRVLEGELEGAKNHIRWIEGPYGKVGLQPTPRPSTNPAKRPEFSELESRVRWFGDHMIGKLLANNDKPGWTNESFAWLVSRLREEVLELEDEIVNAKGSACFKVSPTETGRIVKECADVANFAMMIADVATIR